VSNTEVDTAAVCLAAGRFAAAADILDGTPGALRFGGALAGRAHAAHGDALRAALDGLAAALRADADRYAEAELRAVAVLQ
jgi:hypothetical protein